MREAARVSLAIVSLWALGGCRTATRVTEVPRVDLDLSDGNRGYLVGTPPAGGELKATRQMIETDVEVPSFSKPKRSGTQVGLETLTAPEADLDAAEQATPAGAQTYDTYVVQKGDSLWSIAAKAHIYGRASAWRRIFEANRDLLRSPERVRPGMTLKIPRGDAGAGVSTTYGDEGVTYKK